MHVASYQTRGHENQSSYTAILGMVVTAALLPISLTPGTSNGSVSLLMQLPTPLIDPPSGFCSVSATVEITCDHESATIRYTLDGSVPTESSPVYTGPLRLDRTTIIRTMAFSAGFLPSAPVGASYIVDHYTSLPVVSILTAPANLWSDTAGIYVEGPGADSEAPHYGANYWHDWEIPAHIDFFEPNGDAGVSLEAGVKIHGGLSRTYRQKSLRFTARNDYGPDWIDYPFFPDLPIFSFKSLILRNSGQDWRHTMVRDALMTGLARDAGIGTQAYRPAVVYLNGQYWGIHNIRERLDEHYLSSHYGVDRANIDLLHDSEPAEAGDRETFRRLLDFVVEHDMTQAAVYDSVNSLMDLDNFIRYVAAEIYFANGDWPAHNVRCWRPRTAYGRFQWLLFDTDYGFGWWHFTHDHNTLKHAVDPDGEDASNPPDVARLLVGLLQSERFREQFIVRFCDLMNVFLTDEVVLARIDSLAEGIHDEMPFHAARWYPDHNWEKQLRTLREFARYRRGHVRRHLNETFDLDETVAVSIDLTGSVGGRVRVNDIPLPALPWEGFYFVGLPIRLTAEPFSGYRFVGWEGDVHASEVRITAYPVDDMTVLASFEPLEAAAPGVVITEINYHGADDHDSGDWIELYSFSGDHHLGDWVIRDERDDHEFRLLSGTMLFEGEYLVAASHRERFVELFPTVPIISGNLGFDLSNGGDQVRLYDAWGVVVDSVAFDDEYPWPVQADGSGATLQLIHPAYANELAHNWRASTRPPGDPGEGSYPPEAITLVELVPQSLELYAVCPNPLNGSARVLLGLPEAGDVSIRLYTMQGGLVCTLAHRFLEPGRHRLQLDTADLSSGVYVLRASVPGLGDQSRLVIRLSE